MNFDAGRFFVAISTDNGATWKKEDATEITAIDTVYTTKSLSLDQYAGQAIRVAFYDENSAGSSSPANFLLIDNVRMNCTETYAYADNACEGVDYENPDYGFSIKAEDLPLAGKDSTYQRFAVNAADGCDSVITLTLTTRKASEAVTINAEICEGEVYEFGPYALTEPSEEGTPYFLRGENQYGCDSTIYLNLKVNKSDTTVMTPVEVKIEQLPFVVDDYLTIPASAPVGELTEVVKVDGCQFYSYTITVKDVADGIVNVSDDMDHIDVYDMLGRKVVSLRPGDAQYRLPAGVYMLVSITTDGRALSSHVTVK